MKVGDRVETTCSIFVSFGFDSELIPAGSVGTIRSIIDHTEMAYDVLLDKLACRVHFKESELRLYEPIHPNRIPSPNEKNVYQRYLELYAENKKLREMLEKALPEYRPEYGNVTIVTANYDSGASDTVYYTKAFDPDFDYAFDLDEARKLLEAE